jgi:hypothetical protein
MKFGERQHMNRTDQREAGAPHRRQNKEIETMNYAEPQKQFSNIISGCANDRIPAPETPLGKEIGSLEVSLNALGMVAENLHQRLNAVMRPDNIAPIGNGSNDEKTAHNQSPMSERIANIRARVHNITVQLQNATDRLEA